MFQTCITLETHVNSTLFIESNDKKVIRKKEFQQKSTTIIMTRFNCCGKIELSF